MEKNKGITLIALVVTIIVLIILAGVSISLVLGDNGIITKAKQGKEQYSQSQAKEKLELILGEMRTEKLINEKYDVENKIEEKLEENDIIIEEEIVVVDGWQFEIDRTTPQIVQELGKVESSGIIKNYLYKEGKIATKTGGLIGKKQSNADYKIEGQNYLYTNVLGTWNNGAYIGTKNKIDISKYTKIRCLITTGESHPGSANIACLTLHTEQLPSDVDSSAYYKKSETIGSNVTNYELEWIIPEEIKNQEKQEYYIGFFSCIIDTYVYEIWLEK